MNFKLKSVIKNLFKHPLFSGSAIMLAGSFLANVINYAYHLVMGRVMGPVSYGLLASIFSILYVISVIPASASFSIVKFISSAKNSKEISLVYRGIRDFIIKVAIVVGVVIILFSPIIANFLHINNLWMVILIGPITFINLITLVNQATSQGLLKFVGNVEPTVVSSIFKFGFGVLFVYLGFSVMGAIWGVFIAIILAYLSSIRFIKQLNEKTTNSFDIKPFLKYAWPVLLQALAFTSFFTVDVVMARHFLSPFDAGLYAALSTLGKIIYFAVQPVTAVMFPIVTRKQSKGESHLKIFIVSFLATLCVSLVIVSFYWLFPQIAIGLLYGSGYLSARSSLVWMGLFILIYTLCYNLANYFLSIDKTHVVYLSLLISLIQVISISIWHSSILQIIQVSFYSMTLLFITLLIFFCYNHFKHAKTT